MAGADSVFCPKCNVGFAPDTAVCPICKIPLASQNEYEGELDETPEPVILDDDLSSLKELRTAGVDWIHHLQDKLAEAGIPHRIEQLILLACFSRFTFGPKTCPVQKISMRKSLQQRFLTAREYLTSRIWISRLARAAATGWGKTTSNAVVAA
jgi:hypothetical protein